MKWHTRLVTPLTLAAVVCGGLVTMASAQVVEVELDTGEIIQLDSGVINTCEGEGLNLGACACLVSIMLEAEGLTSMSLTELTRLANAYPMEYEVARAECISVN